MQWIAPAEKDTNNAALEKRLWDAADQFRANSGQDKWARQQPPFGLAPRARRVKNGEGSDPFWTAGTAGTKSRQRGERWSQPHVRQQPKQSNATTRRLAAMNLALRGIEADFGPEHADTFRRDLHPDLRADTATHVSAKPKPRSHLAGLLRSERQLLANPPFNDSDTALRDSAFLQSEASPQVVSEAKDNFRKEDDVRWQFGVPPMTALRGSAFPQTAGTPQVASEARDNNANFAWVQHFIHHLAPHGMAGFVLANGSMSSNQPGEGDNRRALIEADLVDCMVALPGQVRYVNGG